MNRRRPLLRLRSLAFVVPLVAIAACTQILDLSAGTLAGSADGGSRAGCAAGFATCGPQICATNLDSDPENCGECGVRCKVDHAQGACVAGKCTMACDEGFADCDGKRANGCEADLSTSAQNCGTCGHSCLTGACDKKECAAAEIADADGDVRALTLFGTAGLAALGGFSVVARDDSGARSTVAGPPAQVVEALGAATSGLVLRTRRELTGSLDAGADAAGPPIGGETLAYRDGKLECAVAMTTASAVAADDTTVFGVDAPVAGTSRVWSLDLPASCGAPNALFTVAGPAGGVALDAQNVFVTAQGTGGATGTVVKARKDGSAQVSLVQKAQSPGAIVVDQTHVYWSGARGVGRVTKLAACDNEAQCAELFAADAIPGVLAVDDALVYVAIGNDAKGYFVVGRSKTDGSDVKKYASAGRPSAVAAGKAAVFWAVGRRIYGVTK